MIYFKNNWLLVLIFVLGLLLRFVGTNPGYNKFHSDEGISYSAAVSMIKNKNLDPLRYDYPSVVPLVNYVFFNSIFIPFRWTNFFISNFSKVFDGLIKIPLNNEEYRRIFQLNILGEREINALFWGRYVTALISFFTLVIAYLFSKKLFGRKSALISTLFLAVCYKTVANSHIGLPDIYNAFFSLLSLYLIFLLRKKENLYFYLFAGISMGFSFSTKYQFFCVFPFLYISILNFLEFKNTKNIHFLIARFLLPLFIMLFVFIILNPYILVNIEEAYAWIKLVSLKYASGRDKFNIFPLSYFFHFDYGPIIFSLIFISLITAIKKYFKKIFFLLLYLVPFLFITLYYTIAGFYIRNFISITPILMIIASIFPASLINNKKVSLKIVGYLIIIICIYVPLKNSLINSIYYTKPWSYDVIVEKISKVLPEGKIVASHPFDPLPENIEHKRSDFLFDKSYSLSEFREKGADYALINMDWAANNFYGWMNEELPVSLTYWDKPYLQLRNTFWGLSVEEMIRKTLVSAYKPWQAPDAALFFVEVPRFSNEEFIIIKKYVFDREDGWTPIFKGDSNDNFLSYDSTFGKSKKGSLKIGPGQGLFNITRYTSDPIFVEPGYRYEVNAFITSDGSIKEENKEVFLRIDFYEDEYSYQNVGITSALSSRYFGSGWKDLRVGEIAPGDAKYLRISLQGSGSLNSSYWLDDLVVKKSVNMYKEVDNFEKIIFSNYKDLLYPNSHGNL